MIDKNPLKIRLLISKDEVEVVRDYLQSEFKNYTLNYPYLTKIKNEDILNTPLKV